MICQYFYFSDSFKYQPSVCDACHDFNMIIQNLKDFFIVTVQNIDYRVYIANFDKKAAVYILKKIILSDKGVL